ncbi:MAG TPA: hypothetical protein VMM84_00595 [Pyrinomonadaceae bacterium]|nr:hypothetical protein [Pyrinomonadaceae bacterium]
MSRLVHQRVLSSDVFNNRNAGNGKGGIVVSRAFSPRNNFLTFEIENLLVIS